MQFYYLREVLKFKCCRRIYEISRRKKKYRFDVTVTKVPLVSQTSLFDLTVVDTFNRSDQEMAYDAMVSAENLNFKEVNYGVDTGAIVGKLPYISFIFETLIMSLPSILFKN